MGKWTDYPSKGTPADNDTLMLYDATAKANKQSPFSGVWNWIVGKLTNAVISNLQTSNKTVVGALNELNSNTLSLKMTKITSINSMTKTGLYIGNIIGGGNWQIFLVIFQEDGAGISVGIDTLKSYFYIGNKSNKNESWQIKKVA